MDKQKDLEEYVVKHKQEIDEMRNVCDGAFLVVELYDIVKLHKAGYRKEEQTRKETAREIFNNLLKEFYKRKSCGNADVVVYEIAKQFGVEVDSE